MKGEEGAFVKQSGKAESRRTVLQSTASKTHFGITAVCSVSSYVLPHLIHTTTCDSDMVLGILRVRPRFRKMCDLMKFIRLEMTSLDSEP